jgi:hypothetical protein
MIVRAIASVRGLAGFELAVIAFAILGLVGAELTLTAAFHGTHFAGADGKMAQAVILAAQQFSQPFHFNNINPIQGLGSQLLPMNVWLNAVYWPFAFLDKGLASNISGAVALGIFASACYAMSRCFDVPVVPSAIAAQASVLLFAPMLFPLQLSTVFTLMVGNAVVYAPYMLALGLLARLEPGSMRAFILITAGISALLFYSICCDPLWSIVNGSAWAVPFAIVAISPMRARTVFLRCAALGCCLVLLLLSGAAEYLYTLALYTSRVQFPALGDRLRSPDLLASTLFYSPYVKYFYFLWAVGWLLGLLVLRGRSRVLVIAGLSTCILLFAEILVYLLLQNASWSAPLPMYMEQTLFSLFFISAAAGYWGGLRTLRALPVTLKLMQRVNQWLPAWKATRAPILAQASTRLISWRALLAKAATAIVVTSLVPAAVANYAVSRPAYDANLYNEPWPSEPELTQFLVDNTAQGVGRVFRGSSLFWTNNYAIHLTLANLWVRGVPTISEYSQLVTPQSTFFNHAVLKNDVRRVLNNFSPQVGPSWGTFLKVLPMLGMRYYIVGDHRDLAANHPSYFDSLSKEAGQPVVAVPQGPHHNAAKAALWNVYELPHPNLGDYSPVEVMRAESAASAAELMTVPEFDFTRQVVLQVPIDKKLVRAHNVRMSLVRGGLHLSGQSEGTSLVVLPHQFSHCLRARDPRVRLVRANLLLTGVVFAGDIDTDILFDYGIFTPRCRRADLSDIKQLKLHIEARGSPLVGDRLFPSWPNAVAKLRVAASALK